MPTSELEPKASAAPGRSAGAGRDLECGGVSSGTRGPSPVLDLGDLGFASDSDRPKAEGLRGVAIGG